MKEHNMKKGRLMSLLLAFAMVVTMTPAIAFTGLQGIYAGTGVKIGDKEYATLDAALGEVQDGQTITLQSGTYTPISVGAIANVSGKTFTIEGVGADSIVNIGDGKSYGSDGYCDYRFSGANVTFKNLKFCETAGDQNYQGLTYVGKLKFDGCTFTGRTSYWGEDCTIENSTFEHSDAYDYVLWTWGCDKMTIKNCTFNTQGKAIKVYGAGTTVLNVEGCTFNSNGQHSGADKPAITISTKDYSNTDYTINIKNCTQSGFVAGATGSAMYGSDRADEVSGNLDVKIDGVQVWKDGHDANFYKDSDNVWHVVNLKGLKAFSQQVNAGTTFEGLTVVLENDIDMSDETNFTPIGKDGYSFKGTFDGNNKTISNLTISSTEKSTGLFGNIFGGAVKNLTLENPTVSSTATDYTAAVVGHGGYVYADNIRVIGGNITGVEQVAAVVGYLGCGHVRNCTVDGASVSGKNRVGGLVGKPNVDSEYDISYNTVANTTVCASEKTSGMLSAGAITGQVMTSTNNDKWKITENYIIDTTTETSSDTTFVPIGEFRPGEFNENAVSGGSIVNNHWTPGTFPNYYDMYNPNNSEQYVRIYNAEAAVAKIGDKSYSTLENAITAAKSGDTITLMAYVNENVIIPEDVDITLDLAGYTINGKTVANKAALTNNGSLTIVDSSTNKQGTIKREDTGSNAYYTIVNNGKMVIDSANVTNGSGYDGAGASLIINGNTDNNIEGDLTINNLYFNQDNFIVVKNDNGKLTINGGTFSSKGWDGSRLYSAIQNWDTAIINGGTFSGAISTMTYGAASTTGIFGGTFNNCVFWQYNYKNDENNPELLIADGKFKGMSFVYGSSKSETKGNEIISISGGHFDVAPESTLIKAGYSSSDETDQELIDAGYNYTVTVPTHVVQLTSKCDSTEITVATLQGGGTFAYGNTTTVIAPTNPVGYQFDGWYIGESKISNMAEFEYTVTGDVTLVAKYKAVATRFSLSVTGDKYTVQIDGGEAKSYEGTTMTAEATAGTKVVIEYTGTDKTFQSWNNDNGRIMSKQKSYEFVLGTNTSLTGITSSSSESTMTVNFESDSDETIGRQTVTKDMASAIVVPTVPSKSGYTAKGWKVGDTVCANDAAVQTAIDKIFEGGTVLTVKPAYEKKTEKVTLEIRKDSVDGTIIETSTRTAGSTVIVRPDAEDEDGLVFDALVDVDENILGRDASGIVVVIPSGVTKYVVIEKYAEEKTEETAGVVLSTYNSFTDAGKDKIMLQYIRTVPSTYEIVEYGVIYYKGSTEEALTVDNANAGKVNKYTYNSTGNNGAYCLNVSMPSRDTTLMARAYVMYKDGSSIYTVYSKTFNGTWNNPSVTD